MIGALKLVKTIRETYVVFKDGVLVETSLKEIVTEHAERRRALYHKRKEYQLKAIEKDMLEHQSKMRFIQICIEGKIPLTSGTNEDLPAACMEHNVDEKYLDINLRDLTRDRVQKLERKIDQLKSQLEQLRKTPVDDIWLKELRALKQVICPENKKRTIIDLSV